MGTAVNDVTAFGFAVAEFFRFISEPEQDLWWHKSTGYVPITLAGYEKAKAEGYYAQNPGAISR